MIQVKSTISGKPEQNQIIGSIAHAREILLCLSNGINSLSDIARECNFSKSTVHRLLKSLEKYDLAIEDSLNRRYYLGSMVRRLVIHPTSPHRQLVNCAVDEMRKLSNTTEETVALDILYNVQYLALYDIPSRHDLKVTQARKMLGAAFSPLYPGAPVRVLLSQMDGHQLDIALDNIIFDPDSDTPITNRDVLLAQVKETRLAGYSVSRGERILGSICIAVPVKGYYTPVVLSIAGPESRLQPYIKSVITGMVESTQRISEHLAAALSETERIKRNGNRTVSRRK